MIIIVVVASRGELTRLSPHTVLPWLLIPTSGGTPSFVERRLVPSLEGKPARSLVDTRRIVFHVQHRQGVLHNAKKQVKGVCLTDLRQEEKCCLYRTIRPRRFWFSHSNINIMKTSRIYSQNSEYFNALSMSRGNPSRWGNSNTMVRKASATLVDVKKGSIDMLTIQAYRIDSKS